MVFERNEKKYHEIRVLHKFTTMFFYFLIQFYNKYFFKEIFASFFTTRAHSHMNENEKKKLNWFAQGKRVFDVEKQEKLKSYRERTTTTTTTYILKSYESWKVLPHFSPVVNYIYSYVISHFCVVVRGKVTHNLQSICTFRCIITAKGYILNFQQVL